MTYFIVNLENFHDILLGFTCSCALMKEPPLNACMFQDLIVHGYPGSTDGTSNRKYESEQNEGVKRKYNTDFNSPSCGFTCKETFQ